MRTINDTINNTLVIAGGGIISGTIVAFIFNLLQNSILHIDWYLGLGFGGFILILMGESRIYNGIKL